MLQKINRWLLQIFSDSDVNKLLLVIAAFCTILWLFINELAPLLGAVLLAYVLEGAASKLINKFKWSRTLAVTLVIVSTILIAIMTFYALPKFLLQLRELGDKIPEIGKTLWLILQRLNDYLPGDLALEQNAIIEQSTEIVGTAATYVLNNLFSFAGNVFSLFIYMVLLPLLVFFLMRDKDLLITYMRHFFPASPIFKELWYLLDEQFGSYIRGKILEAVLIGASTYIAFLLFNVQYALALSILVGLSVLIPFVGVIAVTFPVVLFTYLQFGWSASFGWVIAIYTVIQIIDAQILVPLLFSEVIKIHPVALFSALIFFGSLWGVWGIFFAIPLAALIKSIISVIMRRHLPPAQSTA